MTQPGNPRSIALVLLNWNGGEFTIPCIRSVKAGTLHPDWLIVHDNGSSDGSAQQVVAAFPDVILTRSDTNLGFAGGCNAGIARALALGADFIWLLNNDTRVAPGCLEKLVFAANADTAAAAVTGKIFFSGSPDTVWYGGAEFSRLAFQPIHKTGQDDGRFDRRGYVPFVSGCCMLLRREAVEQIGAFREYFFAYCEDFDWSLRCRQHGWKLLYEPAAMLWHDVSATVRKQTITSSGGTGSPMAHFLVTRNQALVIRLHLHSPWRKAVALAIMAARRVGPTLGMAVLRRWDKVRALWRGMYEGLVTPLAKVK